MLQGNCATKKVISLKLEANSGDLSAFLLQRNKVLVKQELTSKVKATSENVMDFDQGKDRNNSHRYNEIHGGLLQPLHQHGHNHHRHLFQ
jgi:hypothetical protein